METNGRHIDYFACPVALERRGVLDAARNMIRFDDGLTLGEWEIKAKG
jgi:hypothetical protein